MREWCAARLGDLVSIVGGGTPTRTNPDYYGGQIPWVTPKDMKSHYVNKSLVTLTQNGLDNSVARLVPVDSILIVVRSGVLKHTVPVGVNTVPVAINQDMKALLCSKRIDSRFLARFVKARSTEILRWVRATTADNFPIDKLKEIIVPIPPIGEQRRIAEILELVDVLAAKRHEAISHLGEIVQSIFLDTFGDPTTNPKTWPLVKIGAILHSANYGTSEKAGTDGEFPVLRMNNLTRSGEIDLSNLKYMDLPSSKRDRYLVQRGDILFNRTNSPELVGKTAIYRAVDQVAYAGYLIRLRTNERADPEYLAAFLNTERSKTVLRGMCKSIIGMANINAKEVQCMLIPLPPLNLQQQFASRIGAIERLKVSHRAHLAELDALFASLQYRAFRGEL